MSEKRFRITTNPKSDAVAFDEQQKKYYIGIDFENLLNEQQTLINALKKENKELKEELKKGFDVPLPYVENSMRRLRAEHKVDEQQATISALKEENEQLRMKLKGDDYIMVSEMLSNLRKTRICYGCKNKNKPVEWYLERGFSITGHICDRYEPE